MSTSKEIQELESKLLKLKSKEQNDRIKKSWDYIRDFFSSETDDLCNFTLNKDGSFESLSIVRVEKVRHQPTLPGIGYMAVDYTRLTIGYDYKTKGFQDKYIEKNSIEHEQDFSEFNKVKSPSRVEISNVYEGGFPLKSKYGYKTEYNSIITNGKLKTHTETYEFKNHNLEGWSLTKHRIPKSVFDSMMDLYIKQTLESQEFLKNLTVEVKTIQ